VKAKPHGTQPPSTGELDIAPPVTVGDVEVDMPEDAATAANAAVAAPERVLAPNTEPATTEIAKTAPVRTGPRVRPASPLLRPETQISGFIFDVKTGRLQQVDLT